MYKCNRCGTEYEGKFCPECGERRSEKKICPSCGAEVYGSARFCNECGFAFDAVGKRRRSDTDTERAAGKAYGILKYIPPALFALFAVLLFAIYGGSVIVMRDVLFGGTQSMGNVYSGYDGILLEFPELKAVTSALIWLAVAATVCAAIGMLLIFLPKTKHIGLKLFGRYITPCRSVTCLSFAFYAVIMTIGVIVLSKVRAFDAGAGVLVGGVCPKLLLAFSVVFAVSAAACVLARYILNKKFPKLSERERAEIEKYKAARTRIKEPEIALERVPLLHYVYSNCRLNRAVTFTLLIGIAEMLAGAAFLNLIQSLSFFVISPHWLVTACLLLMIVVWLVVYAAPVNEWNIKEFAEKVGRTKKHEKGKRSVKRFVLYFFVWICYAFVLLVNAIKNSVVMRGYITLLVCLFAVGIALIIAAVSMDRRNHALAKYFFGVPAPDPDATPIVQFDPEHEQTLYRAYRATPKKMRAALLTDEDEARTVKRRNITVCVAAAIIVFVSVFTAIASPLLTDKFSAGYVSTLFTYYIHAPEYMFGKPDNRTERKISNDEIYYDLEYFGNNYKKLYNAAKETEQEMEKATEDGDYETAVALSEKIEALRLQMHKLDHKYLKVTVGEVAATGGKRSVFGVELDTDRCIAVPRKKSVKRIELSEYDILLYFVKAKDRIYAKCYYTDGSYKYAPVPMDALEKIDCSSTGERTLEWNDDWGEYSATVNVTSSLSGELDTDTEYIIEVDENASAPNNPEVTFSVLSEGKKSKYDVYVFNYGNTIWREFRNYITRVYLGETVSYRMVNGLNTSVLKSITVAEGNKTLCSIDGVVFGKDGKSLICIPCGYDAEQYVVPDSVTEIKDKAFSLVRIIPNGSDDDFDPVDIELKLKCIYIHDSVDVIELHAFDSFSGVIYAQSPQKPSGWNFDSGYVKFRVIYGVSPQAVERNVRIN